MAPSRPAGGELVAQLNDLITQLIKENRKLKREVDKLSAKGSAVATGTVERGLKSIQRRVQQALKTSSPRSRPKRAAAKPVRRKR